MNEEKQIAFGYYGGKYSHLDWLLPLLPVDGVHHYCEPFAGSAAVLLNREPVHIETYNDLEGEVVNFFRVLRDDADNLRRVLTLTPFSRAEYNTALEYDNTLLPLERARRFYIRARQTRMGMAQNAAPYRWANCIATDGGTSVSRWVKGMDKLTAIAERLRNVQIENLPAVEIIERYDRPETFFYCDPPYLLSTRSGGKVYTNELTVYDHILLANTLKVCEARVAISGYENELYNEMYNTWHVTKIATHTSTNERSERVECLWCNYDPALLRPQLVQEELF